MMDNPTEVNRVPFFQSSFAQFSDLYKPFASRYTQSGQPTDPLGVFPSRRRFASRPK